MLLSSRNRKDGTPRGRGSRRRGVVLLFVLLVVAILMLVGYQYFNLMQAEAEAVHAAGKIAQSRRIADSGANYLMFVLSQPQTVGLSDASDSLLVAPGAAYDNPGVFHLRPVNALNPRYLGYFSILSPRDPDDPQAGAGMRAGVEDEGGKVNVSALLKLFNNNRATALEFLGKIPGVTPDLAQAILNWTASSGSDPTQSDDATYYGSLGYDVKYGPFESQEELLLVRGMTPRLLLGNDRNRNGILDPDEDDAGGVLDPGLGRYLTVYGRERNLDSQGQPRIFVNDADLTGLLDKLSAAVGEELAVFIVAYRIYGPATQSSQGSGSGSGSGAGSGQQGGGQSGGSGNSNEIPVGELKREDLDLTQSPSTNVESFFDLIDGGELPNEQRVEVQFEKDGVMTRFYSPLRKDDVATLRETLPLLFDRCTRVQDVELPARINVNTAPPEILGALPGISENDVQAILDHRPGQYALGADAVLYRTIAWLATEANLPIETVKNLEPYLTTRSQVFRAQIVGYYEVGGPSVRLEVVVDVNDGRPRLLYWRDVSELGRGFDPRLLR